MFGGLPRQNRDFDKLSDPDTCASVLANYGLSNGEDSEDYTRIRRVLCHAAQIKFLVKCLALSDAPLRSSFRAVCGDDPDKTVSGLKDVLAVVAKGWGNICVPTYRIARALLFAFEDIPLLDADSIRTLMEKAGGENVNSTFAMALKTASDTTLFLAALPKRDANMIKADMEFMGAVPVARVRAAQSKIQSIVCRLILQGKIKLPLCFDASDAGCGKTGATEATPRYAPLLGDPDSDPDKGGATPTEVLTEDVRRGIVDCAVSLRAAIRGFILQEALGKRDEVRAMLGEYSEETDKASAAAMWEEDYKRLKKRVYIRELQGVHKELGCLLCCVPRAATQKFLDGLEPSPDTAEDGDRAIWCAVRWASLLWSDVHFLNCVDISGAWDDSTPSQAATALVGADDKTKRIILGSIAPYDGINLLGEDTVKEWRRDVVKHEMERLVDEASRRATAEEVEAARDEVLNALVICESVKQWMQDRVEGYTA